MMETGQIPSKDGLKLFWRATLAKEARLVLVLVHGFAEHSGRYADMMNWLCQEGISTVALDLRGHGQSGGRRGYIDSFDQYVGDVNAVVQWARKKTKTKQIALLAHSMGGLVGTYYAAQYGSKLSGLILSSPLFGISAPVPFWKRKMGQVMSSLIPAFGLPSGIDPDNLTHDKKVAELYREDPLVFHKATARWFCEVVRASSQAMPKASLLKMPLLMQLSTDDRIVDYPRSRDFYAQCKMVDRSLHAYEGFFHEIYNEVERQKPLSDLLAWIKHRF